MRISGVAPVTATIPHAREPLSYCFVRIETDQGVLGHGEACDSFGCSYANVVGTVVADALAPLLIGEDPAEVEVLVAKLRAWTRRRLGDQWVVMQAISAVEIALWDLAARIDGRSVGDLVGRFRTSVPVYASSVFLEEGDADWHARLLEPLLVRGVRAVKVRLGVEYERDMVTLTQLRQLLGADVALMVDGSENYTLPTALEISRQLADLGVVWFEEPLPQHHRRGIEDLARRSPVPIAYGEHLFGLHDFADCLERGQAQVLQPDAATAGGIAEAQRVALLAEQYAVRVVPHCAAGPVALAANLHLAASVFSIEMLEYPFPLAEAWAIFAPEAELGVASIQDGALPVPSGPGLGVELDERAARARPYVAPGPRPGLPTRFVGHR